MPRLLTVAATAVLGLGLLAGCGAEDDSASGTGGYCADLDTAREDLTSVSGGDVSSVDETLDRIQALREEAPEEVAEAWETLSDGFEQIAAAFEDAGLSSADIEAVQDGEVPDGVDQQALQDAYAQVTELSSDAALTEAVEAIRTHAPEACGIDLQ